MSPEILNPEFKVGMLNPKTFEFGEFWRVNDFLLNPNIFLPLNVCGRTKMADFLVVVIFIAIDGGRWLSHSVTGPGSLL